MSELARSFEEKRKVESHHWTAEDRLPVGHAQGGRSCPPLASPHHSRQYPGGTPSAEDREELYEVGFVVLTLRKTCLGESCPAVPKRQYWLPRSTTTAFTSSAPVKKFC
eukprot:scaffold1365_cov163-Ochromonas_danica.AAC.44